MSRVLHGRPVIPGTARGRALVTREPLSFWGGYDDQTGEIIDRRHELSGANAAGRIFVFPFGRGSSTASGILLQSLLNGTAPAALVSLQVDPILALGVIVAEEMFARRLPLLTIAPADFDSLADGDWIEILEDGTIRVGDPE